MRGTPPQARGDKPGDYVFARIVLRLPHAERREEGREEAALHSAQRRQSLGGQRIPGAHVVRLSEPRDRPHAVPAVGLRRPERVPADQRAARRRRASASRVRDRDDRLLRRGRASRLVRRRRQDRARRCAVDDRRRRHRARGVPRPRFRPPRRTLRDGAALGEPAREGQDGAAALPEHCQQRDSQRVVAGGAAAYASSPANSPALMVLPRRSRRSTSGICVWRAAARPASPYPMGTPPPWSCCNGSAADQRLGSGRRGRGRALRSRRRAHRRRMQRGRNRVAAQRSSRSTSRSSARARSS